MRARGRLRHVAAWVAGLLALPLSVLPFYAYAHLDGTGRRMTLAVMRHFAGPPLGQLSAADAARYRTTHLTYHDALLTLAFGGVMDGESSTDANPEGWTISTGRFADDMQMLHAAGFRTVTPEQVAAWQAGHGALPQNALLLTFDDGRADTAMNAPPILAHLGFRATMFVIGGAYEQAPVFYASPGRLRELSRGGWSIEAHAASGHQSVDAGDGRDLPYLAARRYLPGAHRLETTAEFRARASAEYAAAKAVAERISGLPAIAYAWPFGAYGADDRTNDPGLARVNLELARRDYALGFDEDDQPSYRLHTRADDAMRIARLRVDPTLTPAALYDRIELAVAASAPAISHAS